MKIIILLILTQIIQGFKKNVDKYNIEKDNLNSNININTESTSCYQFDNNKDFQNYRHDGYFPIKNINDSLKQDEFGNTCVNVQVPQLDGYVCKYFLTCEEFQELVNESCKEQKTNNDYIDCAIEILESQIYGCPDITPISPPPEKRDSEEEESEDDQEGFTCKYLFSCYEFDALVNYQCGVKGYSNNDYIDCAVDVLEQQVAFCSPEQRQYGFDNNL